MSTADDISDAILSSPCVDICRMDEIGLCLGCRRSTSEIASWTSMAPEERRRVLDALGSRPAPTTRT